MVLKTTESCLQKNAAELSLEAHANGVVLPKGKFTDLKKTLAKQLQAYVLDQCGPDDPLALDLYLSLGDDDLKLVVGATPQIETFMLGPVIESLNAMHEGLGWFVYKTISAGDADGYPIYTPSLIGSLVDMMWFDVGLTDAEQAQGIRDDYGLSEDVDDEQVFEEHAGGYKPSDVLSSFGGHGWMLANYPREGPGFTQPEALSSKAAQQVIAAMPKTTLLEVVQAAIDLEAELQMDTNLRTHRSAEEDEWGSAVNAYGASCILVWNDHHIAHEVIQHYEENEMNSGESSEYHMTFTADPTDPDSIRALVRSFQDFVRRHAALKKVLQHFPKVNI